MIEILKDVESHAGEVLALNHNHIPNSRLWLRLRELKTAILKDAIA